MNDFTNFVDRIDDEEGVLDCSCGVEYEYKGWNSPETIAWAELHDSPGHGWGARVTKDCSCGLGDHPRHQCAPADYWTIPAPVKTPEDEHDERLARIYWMIEANRFKMDWIQHTDPKWHESRKWDAMHAENGAYLKVVHELHELYYGPKR